jgi:hypothetical protein
MYAVVEMACWSRGKLRPGRKESRSSKDELPTHLKMSPCCVPTIKLAMPAVKYMLLMGPGTCATGAVTHPAVLPAATLKSKTHTDPSRAPASTPAWSGDRQRCPMPLPDMVCIICDNNI